MRRSPAPRFALLALGLVALGADTPMQTIKLRGITFDVPKDWKTSKPANAMRLAQIKVDPVGGDSEPAELVLFAFPGGAGSVKQNLDRWQSQFQDKDGNPPELTTDTRKGKNVDVTYAETAGRYVAAMTPGSPQKQDKADFRLLGAIVQTPEVGYFFKMVGPDKTMKSTKPGFEAMIKTIAVDKD